MRNGKTLLRWMVAMVVVAVACTGLVLTSHVANATEPALEPTESGAPSAMVLFPVTEKPNPAKAAMRPVVFNHLVHEKKVTDCESCHHTGEPVACSTCHNVSATMTDEQMTKGMKGTWASDADLAAATVAEKKAAQLIKPEAIPYKVTIDSIADK